MTTEQMEEKIEETLPPPSERRPSWYILNRGWTKNAAVRDKQRKPCQVNAPRQAAYCLHGAICVAEHESCITPIEGALLRAALAKLLGGNATSKKMEIATIIHWNDEVCQFAPYAHTTLQVAEKMALDGFTAEQAYDWALENNIPLNTRDRIYLLAEKEAAARAAKEKREQERAAAANN